MPETHRNQASPNPRYGSNVGQPLTRRDAVLKVTGRASYAADNHPEGMLYAVCAVSTIARGRVVHLDVEAAKAHPHVVEVITPANRPPLAGDPEAKRGLFAFRMEALQNDRVRYANQPIALVVAKSLEAATEGAALLKPRYEVEPARIGLDVERFVPQAVGVGAPPSIAHSDVETGLSTAPLRIDATYETPSQYHNAMEPHAIVASWDGDRLTIDTPNQAPHMARAAYAGFFGVPPENVLIRTPFIGGGFGSKAILAGRISCACLRRAYGPPGEAGADARPDVRPGRPSRRDAAAPETWHGDRRSARTRFLTTRLWRRAASTNSSNRLPPSHACSTRVLPSPRPMRPFATTSARLVQCALRASPPGRQRSRSPSTKRRRLAAWTRSTSGWRTMPRSNR